MKEKSLVERINEQNLKLYGPIQGCCDLYEKFCRCENKELLLAVKERSKLKTK